MPKMHTLVIDGKQYEIEDQYLRDLLEKVSPANSTDGNHWLTISDDSGNVCFSTQRTDTNADIRMGIGSSGVNRGLYTDDVGDGTGDWLLYNDNNHTYIRDDSGNKVYFNYSQNNTTDTWVPVFVQGELQHRVIPANLRCSRGSAQGGNTERTQTGTTPKVICTTSYTTKTGSFIVTGRAVMKTSRYTSTLQIRVDGTLKGYSCNTNSTTPVTLDVLDHETFTAGSTHTIELVFWAQDSGTTATQLGYNNPWINIWDIVI